MTPAQTYLLDQIGPTYLDWPVGFGRVDPTMRRLLKRGIVEWVIPDRHKGRKVMVSRYVKLTAVGMSILKRTVSTANE